jgi:hypothetical protein
LLRFLAEARSVIGEPSPVVADADPVAPATIAEALENPWFGLPKRSISGGDATSPEGKPGGTPAEARRRIEPRNPVSKLLPGFLPWKARPRMAI